jgi:uncharacterized protein YfaS (alpha-2-macroglobulin family)
VLATSRQTEAFTELYFVDPAHLPRIVATGVTAPVTFRIANHHSTIQHYHAYTSIVTATGSTIIHSDDVVIGGGESADITVPVTLKTSTGAQVQINLPAEHQTLHFEMKS